MWLAPAVGRTTRSASDRSLKYQATIFRVFCNEVRMASVACMTAPFCSTEEDPSGTLRPEAQADSRRPGALIVSHRVRAATRGGGSAHFRQWWRKRPGRAIPNVRSACCGWRVWDGGFQEYPPVAE